MSATTTTRPTGTTGSGIRPVRRRQPLLATGLAVLCAAIVAGLLALVQHNDRRIEVVQVTAAVPVGGQVGAIAPIEVTPVSGVPYVLWSQRTQLSGYLAAVGLVAGQPLLGTELTTGSATPAGDELVGLDVTAGNYPTGLVAGQTVSVRVIASSSASTSLSASSASPVLFSGARVAAVVYSQGTDQTSSTALVNLDLSTAQASELAEGKSSGTIMLSIDGSS